MANAQPGSGNPPPLLQSRSADSLPALSKRPDGRAALSGSPAVLVIYVPSNYYPQPASVPPPTLESAQQTGAIVAQIATGNEGQAVEPARALQAAQPVYAASVAAELQQVTAPSPRYNVVRQVLIELDPALATRAQAQVQLQPQPQTQVQSAVAAPPQAGQGSVLQASSNLSEKEKASRVNALVMSTVPAYLKMPLGMNEGTLQVNTMVVPTPAFLFDQAQIRAALCEIGGGQVVAVYDAIPDAWELKATFIPKDPVRWFSVQDSGGARYYLPNYLDAVRDVQVGDRFVDKGGCDVALAAK